MQITFKTAHGKVVGEVKLSMRDFKSPLVNQKQYYNLVTFDKCLGYLRCALCWDAGLEPVDVKAIKLNMHNQISGIYIPPEEYCASDGLLDEWIALIPNIKEYNEKLEEKILTN